MCQHVWSAKQGDEPKIDLQLLVCDVDVSEGAVGLGWPRQLHQGLLEHDDGLNSAKHGLPNVLKDR